MYLSTSLGELVNNEGYIRTFAKGPAFVPFPPLSLSDLNWFTTNLFDFFDNPTGLRLTGIAALTFLIGCVSATMTNRYRFLLLVSPLFVALLVSAIHQYPFEGRWILFLAPIVLLFVAEGAAFVIDKTRNTYAVIGILTVGLLLFHPLVSESYRLIVPRGSDGLKPVMTYVNTHRDNGDVLYVYYGARKEFWYYADRFGLDQNDYTIGVNGKAEDQNKNKLDKFVADLDSFRSNDRVWFLFANVHKTGDVDERQFMIYYLDQIGTRLDSFYSPRAMVFLYDLTPGMANKPPT